MMMWTEVSPGIFTSSYSGFTITKVVEKTDAYGKDHCQYIAIKDQDKFTDKKLSGIINKVDAWKQKQQSVLVFD